MRNVKKQLQNKTNAHFISASAKIRKVVYFVFSFDPFMGRSESNKEPHAPRGINAHVWFKRSLLKYTVKDTRRLVCLRQNKVQNFKI